MLLLLKIQTPFTWCLYIPGARSCSKLVDNAIHWINLHPVGNAIGFPNTYPMIVIYPLECTIERLNNRGLEARRGGTAIYGLYRYEKYETAN